MRGVGLIILAASGSSRMGQPKPLLPWRDGTLLGHACETAQSTACRPIIVVVGSEAEACRHEVRKRPVSVVVNEAWQQGLGSSIAAGVAALEEEAPEALGALFILVDQPAVTLALLKVLVSRWAPPRWPIVATAYPEGGGVPALFDRRFFPALRLLDSDCGERALIAQEKAHTALVDPGEQLIDLDTPATYQEQLQRSAPSSSQVSG